MRRKRNSISKHRVSYWTGLWTDSLWVRDADWYGYSGTKQNNVTT